MYFCEGSGNKGLFANGSHLPSSLDENKYPKGGTNRTYTLVAYYDVLDFERFVNRGDPNMN